VVTSLASKLFTKTKSKEFEVVATKERKHSGGFMVLRPTEKGLSAELGIKNKQGKILQSMNFKLVKE